VGHFNTPVSPSNRSSIQTKLNREIMRLTDNMNKMSVTDIYRIFHPNTKENTFFSASHRFFSKIDHILGHKVSLTRYKKIKIMPCIFFFPGSHT
jgi:exonuclease III